MTILHETHAPADVPSATPARSQARADLLALHWRRTRRLTVILLALWFALTTIAIWFARELSALHLFGWSLSSYLAAQGMLGLFLAIVGFYAWRMQAIDRACTDALAAQQE